MTISEEWTATRRRAATDLRILRAVEGGPALIRTWIRTFGRARAYRMLGVPASVPKPTVANLRHAARVAASNARFHRSRMGSHDTETYSACGWDDYCGDAAHDALEYARELGREARRLEKETRRGDTNEA